MSDERTFTTNPKTCPNDGTELRGGTCPECGYEDDE